MRVMRRQKINGNAENQQNNSKGWFSASHPFLLQTMLGADEKVIRLLTEKSLDFRALLWYLVCYRQKGATQ